MQVKVIRHVWDSLLIILIKFHEDPSCQDGAMCNYASLNILSTATQLHTHTHTHTHPTPSQPSQPYNQSNQYVSPCFAYNTKKGEKRFLEAFLGHILGISPIQIFPSFFNIIGIDDHIKKRLHSVTHYTGTCRQPAWFQNPCVNLRAKLGLSCFCIAQEMV